MALKENLYWQDCLNKENCRIMSQDIVQEVTFFLHSIFMGVVITFVYDWLLILRKLIKHGTFLGVVGRLLFLDCLRTGCFLYALSGK